MHGTNPRDRLRSFLTEDESIGDLRLSVRIWSCLRDLVELESARSTRLRGTLDKASECLPHITRYDVEASQGGAASECARAAPDGGSLCAANCSSLQNAKEDFGGGAQGDFAKGVISTNKMAVRTAADCTILEEDRGGGEWGGVEQEGEGD
ncbi:unnamed protein product [Nippostrongylus brasiliensis]|uniref:Uncharacterized protein n=1 Tax=Nippostrongylus brasiliensis TaxID=27835 RepID=A0A0N4Y666_NIPBR|nr:unnamed protein product [Nippostrongylus brasiliensis]